MERFILIDGNAIMHRAYHALPPFTTSDGKQVGAVYGFVSMLLRVVTDLKPTYVVVAFDRAAPTFRQELFVGYHANRPSMGDDLSQQFPFIEEVLTALDVPIFGVEGYEGDDVIGTIATKVVSRQSLVVSKTKKIAKDQRPETNDEIEVIIVTGDRDMLQLVNSHVKVYMPIKGLTEAKLFDSDAVVAKYGLEPHQVVDLKALMGDASDNYSGVPGIGPKTASALLQKYHTLEALYQHLGEISERQAKALAEGAEAAGLAKKLATIVTDVPLTFDLEACKLHIADKDKAVATFRKYEFRTLTNRLLELLGEKPLEMPTKTQLKAPVKTNDQLNLLD